MMMTVYLIAGVTQRIYFLQDLDNDGLGNADISETNVMNQKMN